MAYFANVIIILAGANGFPQFASGCAQRLESTFKSYGNFKQEMDFQATDSDNDLQQGNAVGEMLVILILISLIVITELVMITVIAYRYNRRFAHNSKVGCTFEFVLSTHFLRNELLNETSSIIWCLFKTGFQHQCYIALCRRTAPKQLASFVSSSIGLLLETKSLRFHLETFKQF